MYKVGLYTLGCKVSLYETEAVAESFAERGFEVCDFNSVCDVYVINTCTVTAESDAKSRKYIRRAIRKNPSAVVIVMGCYSQRDPEAVAKIDGVSAVIGTQDKMRCVEIAEEMLNSEFGMRLNSEFEIRNSKWSSSSTASGPPSPVLGKAKADEHCSPLQPLDHRSNITFAKQTYHYGKAVISLAKRISLAFRQIFLCAVCTKMRGGKRCILEGYYTYF